MKPTPRRAVLCPACGCAEVYRQRLSGWERVRAAFRTARPYICDGCWCRFWWRPPAGPVPAP